MSSIRKKAEVYLEYSPIIEAPPTAAPDKLYAQACSNDEATISFWRDQWVAQIKANHAIFGPFKEKSLGSLFKAHQHKPCFLLGSGPSLKKNAHLLKGDHGIPIISCLHNFHFCEDLGLNVDYYVTLDAGETTVLEVSEGGNPDTDYWAKTKEKTLLAYVGSHPNLLAKWQGKILFFAAPVPDQAVKAAMDELEKFPIHVSSGGNVLGASLYIAKAYLGCWTTIFLGADFSFAYDESFHPWKNQIDGNLGVYVRNHDVYGMAVKTWPSYRNFKSWFEFVAQKVPGQYINCTEGGIFGSYPEGNIRAVEQMDLSDCLARFSLTSHIENQVTNYDTKEIKILF